MRLYVTHAGWRFLDEMKALALRTLAVGVHRVTAIRLISPKTYQPIDSLSYLQKLRVLGVQQGDDGGKLYQSKNLEPDLPLVLRY